MRLYRKIIDHLDCIHTYKLLVTDYGRSAGWDVYLNHQLIGRLLDAQFDDMFWMTYELVVTEPAYAGRMRTTEFWYEHPITFKSTALNELSNPYVMIVVPHEVTDNRVLARGLYILPRSSTQRFMAHFIGLIVAVGDLFNR